MQYAFKIYKVSMRPKGVRSKEGCPTMAILLAFSNVQSQLCRQPLEQGEPAVAIWAQAA